MSGKWIEVWNDSAAAWGETMLRVCWQGGLLAILAWLLCRLARRIPAQLCAAIWLVVCLKMLVGLSPLSVSIPLLPAEKTVAQPLPAEVAFETPALPTPNFSVAEVAPVPTAGAYLLAAWGIGVVGIVAMALLALGRMRSLTRRATAITDSAILAMAHEAGEGIGLRSLPRLLETDAEVGALTVGAFRPAVLLSRSVLAGCSESELKMILAHELAHVRRRDVWLALVPQAMAALLFFHPLAWVASRELELAREAACDEMAITAVGVRSETYGRLLLKLGSRRSATPLFAMRISSHFRVLSRRINMLDQVSNRSRRRLTARGALLAALAGPALIAPWNLVHAQAAAKQAEPSVGNPTLTDKVTFTKLPQASKAKTETKPTKRGQKLVAIVYRPKVKNAYQVASELHDALGKEVKRMIVSPGTITVNVEPSLQASVLARLHAIDQATSTFTTKRGTWTEVEAFEIHYADGKKVLEQIETEFHSEGLRMSVDKGRLLVFNGTYGQIQRISKRIQALDKAPEQSSPAEILKVVPLKYSNATEVAGALTKQFEAFKVKIATDDYSNSLIIRASEYLCGQVIEAVKKIDVRPELYRIVTTLGPVTKRFPLKTRDAKEVYAALTKTPVKGVNSISYDPTDNSIIVQVEAGLESLLDEIGKKIAKLDGGQ